MRQHPPEPTPQPIPTAATWWGQYLEAINRACAEHEALGAPPSEMQLMMTIVGRQALVQALTAAGALSLLHAERYLNIPVVQYSYLERGPDWCLVGYYSLPDAPTPAPISGRVPLAAREVPQAPAQAPAVHTAVGSALVEAIDNALGIHLDARHELKDLRLYLTAECQQLLEAEFAEQSKPLECMGIALRRKVSAVNGDWCLCRKDPVTGALGQCISGSLPGPALAPAPEVRIAIPTREAYEDEAPRGGRSWAGYIGKLVAAALEGPGENLPEFWSHPQICEAHPHLPFPHGTIDGVPSAGCSGPGMPAPYSLRPGQPAPTRIVLEVVGKAGGQ